MLEIGEFLDGLKNVRKSGLGWSAQCPTHNDQANSLSVTVGEKGIVANCHANQNCTFEGICEAIGVKIQDTFIQQTKPKDKVEAVYDYTDENGVLVFQVIKKRLADGRKTFSQRVPSGDGGWSYSTAGVKEKPLYRLPEVVRAIANGDRVLLTEGEKDADTLAGLGYIATTAPEGAGKWRSHHSRALAGANVVIIADNDIPGYRHAQQVYDSLNGVAAKIERMAPPEGHKDTTDALEAGLSLSDFRHLDYTKLLAEHDPWREVIDVVQTVPDNLPFERRVTKAIKQLQLMVAKDEESWDHTTWTTLLSKEIPQESWVIPKTLEYGERVIVVAEEGLGKSLLASQIALFVSSGLNPFRLGNIIPPRRTLMVDLENSERNIHRNGTRLLKSVQSVKADAHPGDRAMVFSKPDGINILNPKDFSLLERLVDETQPDIIFLGPIYKLYITPKGSGSTETVSEVVRQLDLLKELSGAALWLEHHSPIGGESRVFRPSDSQIWLRWPDYGFGLVKDKTNPRRAEITRWRGDRERGRDWPKALLVGNVVPWVGEYDT